MDYSDRPVPDLFNYTFHSVDQKLGELAQSEGTSSGCTAVTVFLRLEDEEGKPLHYAESGGVMPSSKKSASGSETDRSKSGSVSPNSASRKEDENRGGLLGWARRMRQSSSGAAQAAEREGASSTNEAPPVDSGKSTDASAASTAGQPGSKSEAQPRRVLYTANVGDARAVLW